VGWDKQTGCLVGLRPPQPPQPQETTGAAAQAGLHGPTVADGDFLPSYQSGPIAGHYA